MKKAIILVILNIFITIPIYANGLPDRDRDAVPDYDEINIYFTNPDSWDTDGDGYSDWLELNHGYSPYTGNYATLAHNDFDNDGLTDREELSRGLNPTVADGKGKKSKAGISIFNLPIDENAEGRKVIVIDTDIQELAYYLGEVELGRFIISTGKPGWQTPKGEYKILSKNPRAWSRLASLWMPYWMQFTAWGHGIHELPEWPGGLKEGENHLGTPVSHGCVRLGVGAAERLYNWAEVGTKVVVK